MRKWWWVLAFWAVLIGVAVPLAGKLAGAQNNDNSAYLPASAESTKVLSLQHLFQPTDTVPAIVVYERRSGVTGADRDRALADAKALGAAPGVGGAVVGPVPAADGTALQIIAPVVSGSGGWDDISRAVGRIKTIVGTGDRGLTVHVTGPAGVIADTSSAFNGIDGTLLYSTLAVVIVILLLTYRSPLLWLLPVISAGVALTTAQAVVYLLARHAGLTVNAESASILTVLVFGAGTDYALLLVAPYREELRRPENRPAAMGAALRRAGPAVVATSAPLA